MRFEDSNKFLHIYLYEQNFGGRGKIIHHIDTDRLNNDLHNLISLSKIQHDSFKHARVIFQDWKSGYSELKKQLNLKDSDFPTHIKEYVAQVFEERTALQKEESSPLNQKENYHQRLERLKKKYPSAYEPWTEEAEKELIRLANEGKTASEISKIMGRTYLSIRTRLNGLGLVD